MASVISVTNEVNQQIAAQVPNIVLLVKAAEATGLNGAEKAAGVVQVTSDILATTHGIPANVEAVAQSVNLIVQLFNALGIFRKKSVVTPHILGGDPDTGSTPNGN